MGNIGLMVAVAMVLAAGGAALLRQRETRRRTE
jgi:hypothetical protein